MRKFGSKDNTIAKLVDHSSSNLNFSVTNLPLVCKAHEGRGAGNAPQEQEDRHRCRHTRQADGSDR